MEEIEKCSISPARFLTKYAWIQNKNTAQIVRWKPWDYLIELLSDLEKYHEIVLAKARQLGVSWLLAGFALHKALFSESAKVLFLSQGESEAWDLLDKSRFIWSRLPDFLRADLSHDTRSLITFKYNESKLEALPSTDKAGRGTDATVIIRDELAQHPYARENFVAIGPAIDSGGQLVDLSTIDKVDEDNHFTSRVVKALNKETNAHLIDLANWRLRPVRQEGMTLDQWFTNRIKPKYEDWEIEQEYPSSLQQALSPPKTTCRFDVDKLDIMKTLSSPLLRLERNGLVRIYKEAQAGLNYVFSVDPSEGEYDPSAGIIVEWRTNEKVADFRGKISLDEQAVIIADLYERYHKPYTGIERNSAGILLIDKALNMGVKNMHYTDKDKPGWWTSSANRSVMIVDLAEAVRLLSFVEPSEDALSQFYSFIRTKKKPEGEARGGRHDEFPTCWGIYFQLKKRVKVGPTFQITHFQYKE